MPEAFSLVIIIEYRYLQTFIHPLIRDVAKGEGNVSGVFLFQPVCSAIAVSIRLLTSAAISTVFMPLYVS